MRKVILMAATCAALLPFSLLAKKSYSPQMVMPEFLEEGDTIAIISPASIPDSADVKCCVVGAMFLCLESMCSLSMVRLPEP